MSSPLITKMEKIIWTSEREKQLKNFLPHDWFLRAKKNSSQITAYRIMYTSNDHQVAGYIIEPRKIKTKLPAIIVNRGGAGDFGDIRLGRVFTDLADLALQGYILFVSQLSGHPMSEGKDEYGGSELNDILVFKTIIEKYPNAEAKKIGMLGFSRGAMMTYLTLAKIPWIKAAVCLAGPTNLIRMMKLRPEMKKVFKEAFGGSTKECKQRSAIFWPEKISKHSPLLIMHGTADQRVSVMDSLELSHKLVLEKIPHRLIIFENGDHDLSAFSDEVKRQTFDWFERFLKKGENMKVKK